MITRCVGVTLAIAAGATPAVAQVPFQSQFDSAYYAWDAGRYIDALERLERLLTGPGGDQLLEPIALLTGELYRVVEVAPDGRALRWSTNGRFAAYETGSGVEHVTHIVAIGSESVRQIAQVRGAALALSPDGNEAAYLVVRASPALRDARAEVNRRISARDFASFRRRQRELARLNAEHAQIMVRDLRTGREREVAAPNRGKLGLTYGPDGKTLYFTGNVRGDTARTDIYAVTGSSSPRRITDGPGYKDNPRVVLGGSHLSYVLDGAAVGVVELATARTHFIPASSPAISADGSTLAFIGRDGEANTVNVVSLRAGATPVVVMKTTQSMARTQSRSCSSCPVRQSIALSPDGSHVAYQLMPREDWEVYVVASDGTGEMRLTQEIQHDLFPQFLANDRILALIGESRHRRSYLYDAATGERTRLFHNNTVRTVAPEYEWAASPDGTKVLIVSERDGDTISPERGVYLVDLTRKVTVAELLERVRTNLARERDLRERGRKMYGAIADRVRAAVADASSARIYDYEKDLFRFGSKHITQPGNSLAIEYIQNTLRSFGYEPELQWFEPRGQRSANLIATLPGTVDPELIYVVSSHFDSVNRGPGSDDNTSGTVALLEAARVMASRPMPATIKFAFFTGEEAGLLGSREFVRRAVAAGDKVLGALNNDMIGWSGDHRLDNTIRYSNDGIRDLQHAAAFLFTDLITYDAKYYKSTDAHAYYEAYGDIVGGIGSYPILGNPHYHQSHDVLETINHGLVAEVSKTTVASIMLLASSPSRLTELAAERRDDTVELTWTPALETGVTSYIVAYGPQADPMRHMETVSEPRATLTGVGPVTAIGVKAVNERGMEGWDWARVVVGR